MLPLAFPDNQRHSSLPSRQGLRWVFFASIRQASDVARRIRGPGWFLASIPDAIVTKAVESNYLRC